MVTPGDLLDFAVLSDIRRQPEVAIRRAMSAAYYAAFHAIAQAGADLFAGSAQVRRRLTRSYDHGAVRAMAAEMERYGKQPGANPAFARVGRFLPLLREARENADYDLQADLTWEDCVESVVMATEVLTSLSRLKSDPAFAELILLPLLRDRNRRG